MARNSNRFSSCQKYVLLLGGLTCVRVWKMTLSESDASENNSNHAMMRHLSTSIKKKLLKLRIRETITFTFTLLRRYVGRVGTRRCAVVFFFCASFSCSHDTSVWTKRRHYILYLFTVMTSTGTSSCNERYGSFLAPILEINHIKRLDLARVKRNGFGAAPAVSGTRKQCLQAQHKYIYCKSNDRRPMAAEKLLWILMTNKGFVKCEWLSLPLALPFHLVGLSVIEEDGWTMCVCLYVTNGRRQTRGFNFYAMCMTMATNPKNGIDDGHHKIFTHQITNRKNGIFITASTTAATATADATICHLQYLQSTRCW